MHGPGERRTGDRAGRGGRGFIVAVAVVGLMSSGCATENRALALREQARAAQGGSWSHRWTAAREAGWVGSLLTLSREYFQEHPDGATEEEVRRLVAADVRSFLMAPDVSASALRHGQAWAATEMHDEALADQLLCRGAELHPEDQAFLQACSERSPWPAARELLLRAAALPGADRCKVVAEFDRRSPAPEAELRDFTPMEVRRCRIADPASGAEGARPGPPGAGPAPEDRRQLVPSGPPPPELDHRPLTGGLELGGELVGGFQGGQALQGVQLAPSFGWGNARFAVAVLPALGWSSVPAGTASVELGAFSLSAAGRLWLVPRRPQALAAFLQLDLGFATTWSSLPSVPSDTRFVGRLALGAEYLLGPHLGLTGSLGVRLLAGSGESVGLVGALGVAFHQ